MTDTIKVTCENIGATIDAPMGTTLGDIARELNIATARPFLAAYVNHRIKELGYKIYTPVTVRFIDITSFEGIRVYQRTCWFLLQKAAAERYPGRKLHIRHSMGGSGFYCEIEGIDEFPREEAAALRDCMRRLADADLPIRRRKTFTSEVREIYRRQGLDDKVALLDTRPRLYSDLYTLDGLAGYFYGSLAPSTGYVTLFDIEPCYNGFRLALPLRTAPDRIDTGVHQEKMSDIFREYQRWVNIMGVPTVGDVNSKVLAGDAGGMIKLAEAFHERKLAEMADAILEANAVRGVRTVLISGPSSSGKTTTAKRLGIQLRILGLNPVLISLDDYFVERDKTPLDENGDYDFEALEAIDLELLASDLKRLFAGESVDVPRYDFITGTRKRHDSPLKLDERSILIMEGIHGLNPALTPGIPREQKFCIYVSCLTSVAMDNMNRIATTDNRLLRRLTRDYYTRGHDAAATLQRWPSVRRGEERHIFPYQENADVMFNSSLFYEISVLRSKVEPILREVPDTLPEYGEAKRLLKFLDNFIPIASDEIPPTSILREFIGGSSFKY